ncbi:MAG: hypothetical protein QT11_C0001G0960 [archaeon GW2011_AR20]|nr:MAG: hypothetical protein QT11_C0001G0960 [archaeon GW2011_AR20]MBS3160181.1 hypothetical protein [Candidatus Woesearchaeota archaeon]
MFDEFIKRENKIFETLQELIKNKIDFIVVGGYGVSSYKHRFSVDADLIIKKEDKPKIEEILKNNEFVKTIVKNLDYVYAPQFIRYETKEKPKVSVDLLIDGIGSRGTNASFSFNEVKKYSKNRKITGTEKEVSCLVPDKEILIIFKLHAGRLTDLRDIVALSKNINIDLIKSLIFRGDKKLIRKNIEKLFSLINDKGFMDSFKGVFIEKKYDVDLKSLNMLKELIKE